VTKVLHIRIQICKITTTPFLSVLFVIVDFSSVILTSQSYSPLTVCQATVSRLYQVLITTPNFQDHHWEDTAKYLMINMWQKRVRSIKNGEKRPMDLCLANESGL
jgi:hypothetical protein